MQSTILDDAAIRVAEAYRRKKVTSVLAVMFTDIAGSTELREELGEVAYEQHREVHEDAVRGLVESGGAGAVVKSTGDGVMAVFAEPSEAVVKALAIQMMQASHDIFRLRIGIDMGQVSLTSQGGIVADVFGRQVNRAARIQSLSQPDHILTSFHVYDCALGWLTGTGVKWHNHGMATLKGFSERVSIHEPYDPRFLSPQASHLLRAKEDVEELSIMALRPVSRSIRLVLIEQISFDDPFKFYRQAIALAVARLVQARSGIPLILWVDDYPTNTAKERELLVGAGCRFDLALTTTEAESKLSSHRYSLIISDMGRGSNPIAGIELLESMQSRHIACPTLVYCSSRAVSLYSEDAVKKGALLCTAGVISLLDGVLQILEQSVYFMQDDSFS
jgi:class 3 adenylate cyclase